MSEAVHYTLAMLQHVASFCLAASVCLYAAQAAAGLWFAHKSASPPPLPKNLPLVALLKPLHGVSRELPECLETFFRLDYPRKLFVFGITDENDPAGQVVKSMKRRHPSEAVITTMGEEPASNRKIGKLARMVRAVPDADIIVMTDADMEVAPDYLCRVVAELQQDHTVGLVTCACRARPSGPALAARLEALFVNTDFTPITLLSNIIEPMRHAYSATIAIRREVLEAAGGLEKIKNCSGDDIILGRRVAQAGYKVRLSSAVVTNVTDQTTIAEFWQRELRGARVDRIARPISTAKILINGPFWGVALLAVSGFSGWALGVMVSVLLARLALAALILERVLSLPRSALRDLWLVPLKDLFMAAVWFVGLRGNTVQWRSRRLRLLPNGLYEEIEPPKSAI